MPRSLTLALALTLTILPTAITAKESPPVDTKPLQTLAERTQYQDTDSALASFALLDQIANQSPDIRMQTFGLTPEGRELKWVLAGPNADQANPEDLSTTTRVLLIAGIHAGEIEGKDAGIALLRDLTDNPEHRWPYPSISLAFVPIFNLDGHERRSPFNRANQNGPANMGWRGTSQRYNLNRDFLKADTVEMRALLGLWNQFQPHLVYDSHTTDGADYQYDLTWHLEQFDLLDSGLRTWQKTFFVDTVFPAVAQRKHLLVSYPEPLDSADLKQGVSYFVSTAKYSTGYAAARNRPVLLIETHMLKDYQTRVRATYDLLDLSLKHLVKLGQPLQQAVLEAEQRSMSLIGRQVVLTTQSDGSSQQIPFKGFAYETRESAFSGSKYAVYDTEKPKTIKLPYFYQQKPAVTVTMPAAYVLPPAYRHLLAQLDRHQIEYQALPLDVTVTVTEEVLSDPKWAPASFEGRVGLAEFQSERHQVERVLPAGSILIPAAQPNVRVLAHLLEPTGPDSLLRLGYFNMIFEQREYAEPRVAENMAATLAAKHPEMKAAFDQKVANEPAFAANPFLRLNWWFMRSDWREQDLGRYPVWRLDADALRQLAAAQPDQGQGG
ncbi:M14 family metallopeptidase [Ahniella affigens]|nr:M14 family metallopeptidase [Ahniella affigens]